MKELTEIRNQFSRIIEQSIEQRGFKTIHGRIIANLLISTQPLTQQEIVEKTGYSVSAISRTLDELENFGSVVKFKKPGERSYRYESTTSIIDSLVNFLQKWLMGTKHMKKSIKILSEKLEQIDKSHLKDFEVVEASQMAKKINNIIDSFDKIIPPFDEFMLQLNKLKEIT
jgi:DNA-binding transcriptional regulator GbsR (MarR family)